ncbi:MAG: N-acetylmuramic acid 6-phosphate etherase [marine benthic group bacterium]|nr:N-acetylmuramic acid 6-phosphate etherase [Candidatus Benthicola marisminoris]
MKKRQRASGRVLDLQDSRHTEAFNPRTAGIDDASPLEVVRLLNEEDRTVSAAVASQEKAIAAVIAEVADRLRRGGRLFYVGAGTSGRLGVLDAAECPPTFGSHPSDVQGVMAGGSAALVRSREGVEDDREAGAAAIVDAAVGSRDFVLGIASSGTTPFVHAALDAAHAAGAGTGILACTPPPEEVVHAADHAIVPLTGAEAIAGSTRLKAGTATKLVLNTISTGVMIQLGKVYGNLMVDLRAVSRKLVDRSLRMVSAVTGLEREEARQLLVAAGGTVKTAIAMHETRVGRFTAERRLDICDGFLGRLVHRFPPGSPVRDFAEFPPGRAEEWESVVDQLAVAPAAVREAIGKTPDEDAAPTVGRPAGDIAWQVGHLERYEREAIRPRVEAWPETGVLEFVDWEDETAPGPADDDANLSARTAAFAAQREATVQALRAAGPSFLDRRGRQGAESFSAYQFLRATIQHDRAHVARIGERLHRSLLVESE